MTVEEDKQLQVDNQQPSASGDTSLDKAKSQKELVEQLRVEWKLLWSERFNDKVRAEGISVNDYASLWVERGTIIHATRDFKALNFKEILEQHMVENPARFAPDAQEGGWGKFVKTNITNKTRTKRTQPTETPKKTASQQPKKGGRGWLHTT